MTAQRSPNWRKSLWSAIALALALAVAWTLRPQPLRVSTAPVTRGTVSETVAGEGRTRVRALYVVATPVDGQLERVAVQLGDTVDANATVATIRPAAPRPLDVRARAEARAALDAAKVAVERAHAAEQGARIALEHADSQLDIAGQLARAGTLPSNELTHAGHEAALRRSALDAAIAASSQARAEHERARAVLGAGSDAGEVVPVRAPASGRVLRVLRESAGPVAAGTPLLELGNVQQLEVEADLLSSDAVRCREGAAAGVMGWGGARLEARVRRIAPGAFTKVSALGLEEQRVHVLLDFAAAPPRELGHAYRVDVAVVVWEEHDILRIPAIALFRDGERWAVFRVANQRAQKVQVDISATDGTWTAVTHGLSEGDEVITQPSDAIETGTRVTPP